MVFQCIKNSEIINEIVSAAIKDDVSDILVTEDHLKKRKKEMVRIVNNITFFLSSD